MSLSLAVYAERQTMPIGKARLADVLARIAEHPSHRLAELLPWNWKAPSAGVAA